MLSKEEARKLAEDFIKTISFKSSKENESLVIIDEYTLEKDFGWLFSYNLKTFSETRDFGDFLIGGGPVIVNKFTGEVEEIPGGFEMKEHLARYEQRIKNI